MQSITKPKYVLHAQNKTKTPYHTHATLFTVVNVENWNYSLVLSAATENAFNHALNIV